MNARPSFLPPPDKSAPVAPARSGFRFPGPADRLTVNGMTGSGKTTFAFWLFAESADFNKKPWVFIDYKGEPLLSAALSEKMAEEIPLKSLPKGPGVFVVRPDVRSGPEQVIDFLWRVYNAGHIGVFLDEATMIPELRGLGNSGGPYQSLLSQGRSKVIPVWTLAQRPAHVNKMVYSESNFSCAFKLKNDEDLDKLIKEAVSRKARNFETVWGDDAPDLHDPAYAHYSRWYDEGINTCFLLRPVPPPDEILSILFDRVDRLKEKRSI
jgi:hypothetical protein